MRRGAAVIPWCVPAGLLLLTASALRPHSAARPAAATEPRLDDLDAAVGLVNAELRRVWTAHSLQPAGRAEDLTVLRRLFVALHGSQPSLEEVRRFEADLSPDRLRRRTDSLLADPRIPGSRINSRSGWPAGRPGFHQVLTMRYTFSS